MPVRILPGQLLAADALNYSEMRAIARRRLPRGVFEYIDGGAEDQVTLRAIQDAWENVVFCPKVLVDTSRRSQRVNVFGASQSMPCIVAPTAMAGLVWHDGEVELARAAKEAEIPFCVSTQSVTAIESIARTGARLWFQLYVFKDRTITASLVDRARAAGAEALLVTVDTQVSPKREYNTRNGFGIPIRPSFQGGLDLLAHPRWVCAVLLRHMVRRGIPTYAHYPEEFRSSVTRGAVSPAVALADDLNWGDINGLRRQWSGPLVIKGILRPDDALRAVEAGVDGIVVSNHGGRNLDGCVPVPLILRRIADAAGGRIAILADSGIRRGSHVLKAMALGADAVMVGRSVLYGLAAGGKTGAARALENLRDEISRTMAYVGCNSLSSVTRDLVANGVALTDPNALPSLHI